MIKKRERKKAFPEDQPLIKLEGFIKWRFITDNIVRYDNIEKKLLNNSIK